MATDANDKGQATEKVVFDEKQQARVDELIREAMGRAAREERQKLAEMTEKVSTYETKLGELETKLNEATSKKTPKGDADADALRAQIEEFKAVSQQAREEADRFKKLLADKDSEVKTAKQETMTIKKRVEITSAASKTNFIDLNAVIKLTEDSVKWDEGRGRFIVINEQGGERMNASYEPMSLEEFYQEVAAKQPYLVRGDFKGGAGSAESQRHAGTEKYKLEDIFGGKSNSRLANELARKDPAEYKRMKAAAKSQGLI